MQHPIIPPKPINETVHPEITRLPELTFSRLLARKFLVGIVRFVVWLFTKVEVTGLDNIPLEGPLLAVSNHLGDADLVLGAAFSPRQAEVLAKAELRNYPVLSLLLEIYGVIWIHRGQPDRRAIRAALQGLAEGRVIGIAPEGRESLTGSLEEGTHGAAYLAYKTNTPIVPITFTGTENSRIFPNMKRLRRTPITITIGAPLLLEHHQDWRNAIDTGTQTIMLTLASQLPPQYRGVYLNQTGVSTGQT